jgi:hypothetical protein
MEIEEVIQSIKNNNSLEIKRILKDVEIKNNEFNIFFKNLKINSKDFNKIFQFFCGEGNEDVVRELLKDSRVKVDIDSTFCIQNASQNGNLNIIKLLLKDPRVDPSDDHNAAIRLAYENNYIDIVLLLWNEPIIKKTLSVQSGLFDTRKLYYMLKQQDIKNKIIDF